MKKYAVVENGNILNTIVADSKQIAEEITGNTCIEYTTEPAESGGSYQNGIFIKRKPFDSWILNANNFWEAPISCPEVDEEDAFYYEWDESVVSWVKISKNETETIETANE